MNNILIRTLGGGSIGYGHFFRCLSLAKAIKQTKDDTNVIFLINEELVDLIKNEGFKYLVSDALKYDEDIISSLEIDLFILDTYLGDDDYLKMVKKQTKLMLIDDNNDIYDSTLVDIIYNGNIHAEKLNYPYVEDQLRLLGTEYLIMKEEYWDSKEDGREDNKSGVLITTGGSDEHGIAIDIINSIKALDIDIRLIIGPGYKDDYIRQIEDEKIENIELIYSPSSLKDYINESKIVITAGGSTVYEVLSQGSIPVIFNLADNQDMICEELDNMGIAYLGKYPQIDLNKLEDIIKEIMRKEYSYKETYSLIDGLGALKVSNIIKIL